MTTSLDRFYRPLLLVLGLSLTGCPSMTSITSARTLDSGQSITYIAPEYSRFTMGGEPLVEPQVEIGGRYGITDNWEMGAKLWLPGIEINSKIAILRSKDENSGFNLSFTPGVSYLGGVSGTATGDGYELHVLTLYGALHAGWNVGGGHEIVVSPKLANQTWTTEDEEGTTANLLFLGGSLGFVWKITEGFRLLPEIAVGAPIVESVPGFGTDVGIGATLLQAGVALVFGGA